MDKKEEIESHIKFAKENREYFDNKIIAYETVKIILPNHVASINGINSTGGAR